MHTTRQICKLRLPVAATLFVASLIMCVYNISACWHVSELRLLDYVLLQPTATLKCACTDITPACPPPAESAARLYFPEGHDAGRLLLSDRHLSPLTKWMQAFIHKHQHPAKCDRILISDGHRSGFGSEMHVIGAHLAYAIQNNYVLVLSNETCTNFRVPHSCTDGCACMLRPISNCSAADDPAAPRIEGGFLMAFRLADVFVNALRAQFPSMTVPQMKYWWRGQSAAYVMRFNDDTLRVLRTLRHNRTLHYATHGCAVPFPLPANTISVHIRGGDKWAEMPLVPAQNYVSVVLQLVHNMPHSFSRTVFLSGDDQQSIDQARQLIEDRHMSVIYTRMPRLVGGHRMSDWRAAPDESEGSFYAHLLQLLMALEADAWVGTRGSNWNRLIDEMRCVWVDKCQGVYVEAGQPPGQYSW
jgi:hypothetical protein